MRPARRPHCPPVLQQRPCYRQPSYSFHSMHLRMPGIPPARRRVGCLRLCDRLRVVHTDMGGGKVNLHDTAGMVVSNRTGVDLRLHRTGVDSGTAQATVFRRFRTLFATADEAPAMVGSAEDIGEVHRRHCRGTAVPVDGYFSSGSSEADFHKGRKEIGGEAGYRLRT